MATFVDTMWCPECGSTLEVTKQVGGGGEKILHCPVCFHNLGGIGLSLKAVEVKPWAPGLDELNVAERKLVWTATSPRGYEGVADWQDRRTGIKPIKEPNADAKCVVLAKQLEFLQTEALVNNKLNRRQIFLEALNKIYYELSIRRIEAYTVYATDDKPRHTAWRTEAHRPSPDEWKYSVIYQLYTENYRKIREWEAELARINAGIEENYRIIMEAEKTIAWCQDEKKRLLNEIAIREKEKAELLLLIEEAEANIKIQEAIIAREQANIVEQKKIIAEAEALITTRRKQIADAEKRIVEIEAQKLALQELMNKAEADIMKAEAQIDGADIMTQEGKAIVIEAQRVIIARRAEIATYAAQIQDFDDEKAFLEGQIAIWRKDITNAEKRISIARASIANSERIIADAQAKIAHERKVIADARARIEVLDREIAERYAQIAVIERKEAEAMGIIEAARKRIAELTAQRDALAKRIADLKAIVAALLIELESIKKSLFAKGIIPASYLVK